jgi:hypothetical protein
LTFSFGTTYRVGLIVMTNNLSSFKKPEEEELERKLHDLSTLEADLMEQELHLASLHATLAVFERKYMARVGTRYAALDKIRAEISEIRARQNPSSDDARERANAARKKAEASQAETVGQERQDTLRLSDFTPSTRLKQLYREVAKKVHPDLTADPNERDRRHHSMAEANLAYENADEAGLQKILEDFESAPEWVQGEGPAAELIRTIRKISQVKSRIQKIAIEIEEIAKSDLQKLMNEAEEAAKNGRDLLSAMAETIDMQIREAKEQLAQMSRTATAS